MDDQRVRSKKTLDQIKAMYGNDYYQQHVDSHIIVETESQADISEEDDEDDDDTVSNVSQLTEVEDPQLDPDYREYNDVSETSSSRSMPELIDPLEGQQEVIDYVMSPESENRGLLLWHDTGTGKTLLSIFIIHEHQKLNPDQRTIIACPNGTRATWRREITRYQRQWRYRKQPEEAEFFTNNIELITHQSFTQETFINNLDVGVFISEDEERRIDNMAKKVDRKIDARDCLLFIDEAHKYKMPPDGVANQSVIRSIQIASATSRVFLLTATPVFNWPREAASLYMMIHRHNPYRPNAFVVQQKGVRLFLKVGTDGDCSKTGRNLKNSCLYSKQSAQQKVDQLNLDPTSSNTYEIRMVTRGETKLKSSNFKIIDALTPQRALTAANKELYRLGDIFDDIDTSTPVGRQGVYDLQKCWRCFVSRYLKSNSDVPASTRSTVYIPISTVREMTHPHRPSEEEAYFQAENKIKSKVLNNAYYNATRSFCNTQSKLRRMLKDIREMLEENPRARIVVYASRIADGLDRYETLLLEAFGQMAYGDENDERPVIALKITGNETSQTPEVVGNIVRRYNSYPNCAILLISNAASVGIDLKMTTMVQLMQPEWSMSLLDQAIGRAIRHRAFPEDYQTMYNLVPHVQVNLYISTRENPLKPSGDELVWQIALRKQPQCERFEDALTKASIQQNNCLDPELIDVMCGLKLGETYQPKRGELFRKNSPGTASERQKRKEKQLIQNAQKARRDAEAEEDEYRRGRWDSNGSAPQIDQAVYIVKADYEENGRTEEDLRAEQRLNPPKRKKTALERLGLA